MWPKIANTGAMQRLRNFYLLLGDSTLVLGSEYLNEKNASLFTFFKKKSVHIELLIIVL